MIHSAIGGAQNSEATVPAPAGVKEYFGMLGCGECVIAPKTQQNIFHTIFKRHSMTEIMGVYVEESDN